eukprot:Seg6161.1 transcript_id=Seg6161.1/GoldUCD/mRNA.D3Y31 product="Methylmalonic aciduria and homocystinuria type D protein mitochondrial" protein_id=Seg6161.1/GoldUCD/D3Y31
MAARLLERPARRLAYFPSMKAALSYLRGETRVAAASLSTAVSQYQNQNDKKTHSPQLLAACWPMDPHFPLPGNVGMDYTQFAEENNSEKQKETQKTLANAFLDVEPEDYRKQLIINQFLDEKFKEDIQAALEPSTFPFTKQNNVECSIQECPNFIKKSLFDLFPGGSLKSDDDLTVITVSQQTVNDMTSWTEAVESERESLFEIFVENAKQVCEHLQAAGYWADFIDPSSGQAYFSEHSNSTLFETDERFNHLGFTIDDLGCCKVIRHKIWGSNVFVGTIFTNAPPDCEIFKDFSQQTSK